ncbi:MAG: hypothetical protein LBI69_01665 [Puniceicoccales bacterium]|nr:hypothetical protein [Puniceicoccales bacterium]
MGVLLWKGSAFMSSGDDGGDDDSNELLTPPVMQLDGDKVLFGGLSPVKKENRYENVRVLDVVNIPFSLTLDGFLSFGDDDYVLFIRDNHSKEVHRVTVGEVIPGTQFRVVEVFKVPCENSNNGAGMATEKAYAVIDNELMPPITLRLGEDIYVDIHSVSVECDFKGQKATYVLHEVGQCFTFNSHQYQLTEVMFRDRLLVFTCSDESTGEQSIIPFHY